MRQPRSGHSRPLPRIFVLNTPIRETLLRDYDDIEREETRAADWIRRGHLFEVDIPRGS